MDAELMPWVVVAPSGVYWLGHARDEASAWSIALGWPDEEEVAEHKRAGWYASEATVTWKRPAGVPAPAHSKSEYKRRVAQGDVNVAPPDVGQIRGRFAVTQKR